MTPPLQDHPAAAVFPLLEGKELEQLVEDIRTNGQRHPGVTFEGALLDGRNRRRACELAGVPFKTVDWDGKGGSPTAYVLSVNVRRRHLTESQRAMLAAQLLPLLEEEAKRRQLAGKPLVPAPAAPSAGPDGTLAPRGAKVERAPKSSAQAAAAVGVSARTVERAKAVSVKAPELAAKVVAGEVKLGQAEKAIRTQEQVAKVAAYKPPKGKYGVIVVDPPWPYDKRKDDVTHRGTTPYPQMDVEDIEDLEIPADDECVLWLWVTNAHLIDGTASRVLERWGFTPKTLLTWIKLSDKAAETVAGIADGDADMLAALGKLIAAGGLEKLARFGAGDYLRNVTEHAILAVRGRPLVLGKDVPTVLFSPRREHSRKPDEFYALVERVCPARKRLEMFARESRKGWESTGAELGQFDDGDER